MSPWQINLIHSFYWTLKKAKAGKHLSSEDNGLQTVFRVVDPLRLAHSQYFGKHLGVGQFAVAQHRAPGLNWLHDLLARVAGQGKPSG